MLDIPRKTDATIKDIRNFIAGEYVPAKSGRAFDKRSPVDGRLIARVAEAGETEVDAVFETREPSRRIGVFELRL